MFNWLAKYVRRIDVMGVGVELREPKVESVVSVPLPPAAGLSIPSIGPLPVSSPSGSLAGDRAEFLREVERYAGAGVRSEYGLVLDDLIAWTETQAENVEFRPRPVGNQQATVTYCFRGTPHLFWQVYPRPTKRDAKFSSVSEPQWLVSEELRNRLRTQFAELSGGQVDSPVVPTLSFRNLVTPAARAQLKHILGQVLGELTCRLQTRAGGGA